MELIIALLAILFVLALDFLVAAGLVWVVCWCFSWPWSWPIAFGVWVIIIILRSIFRRS